MNCMITSHSLAKELLNKPDGFIFAQNGEDEYIIDSICRIATHANLDDSVMHWCINLEKTRRGNIKR